MVASDRQGYDMVVSGPLDIERGFKTARVREIFAALLGRVEETLVIAEKRRLQGNQPARADQIQNVAPGVLLQNPRLRGHTVPFFPGDGNFEIRLKQLPEPVVNGRACEIAHKGVPRKQEYHGIDIDVL